MRAWCARARLSNEDPPAVRRYQNEASRVPHTRRTVHRIHCRRRILMATTTQLTPSCSRSRFKTVLWVSLGLTALFVFITSEVFLAADYPMYHAYRLQVIADRHLLIPHVLAGMIALLAGPIQFSSRFRQRHLKIHRVLGRVYVFSVFAG